VDPTTKVCASGSKLHSGTCLLVIEALTFLYLLKLVFSLLLHRWFCGCKEALDALA